MTRSRLASALALSIICAGITYAQPADFPVALFARDPGVTPWTWFQILGPRNHPFPIVYISTQPFMRKPNEFLIVLPQERYEIFSAYTQARIARSDCPGKEPAGDVWYTVQIAQGDGKHTQQCVLPQALACDYISGALKLSGINWTATELIAITGFMGEIECETHRD